jgi:hypothetical protein
MRRALLALVLPEGFAACRPSLCESGIAAPVVHRRASPLSVHKLCIVA